MRFNKTGLTAGFAMFSMFFGSGNLVFPLVIGTQSLDKVAYGAFGLLLTGIIVPFLGLMAIILFAGNRPAFFGCIGKIPAFLLTLAMLSLMGPFGVIPRCILVSYGGIQLFWPNLEFHYFAAAFCLVTMLLVWKHDRIVPIIGRILTPALLVSIFVIIIAGFFRETALSPSDINALEVFLNALNIGYQTMDLLAAFFFSATTVAYLYQNLPNSDEKSLLKLSVNACLIGGGLLAAVYVCFILLGAHFAPKLSTVNPEQMLAAIAGFTLGDFAIPVASAAIALACLTTATILVMLFADFVHEDACNKKYGEAGEHFWIIVTLLISFTISLSGFDKLAIWIQSALWIAYPALIALAVANSMKMLLKLEFNWGCVVFWTVLAIIFIFYVVN